MFFSTTLATLGLASFTTAHMIMNTPVPYGKSTLNNSPLDASGSDFPCKQRSGVYVTEGANNVMPLGSTQSLSFTGSATHGGGSCQVSITYDQAPTKSSTFKVIHSIEGGCPIKGVAGNNGDNANAVDPSTYSFTLPSTLPTGNATLAWTWFNKIGNREMYMNCAPISITSSSSKRSEIEERDTAAFNALPDMFVANIGNGCGTVDSTDLLFPNPGGSVEQDGASTSTALSKPTGSCQAAGAGSSASASVTAGSSGSQTSAAAVSSAKSSASSVPGGVFATVASSAKASSTIPAVATSAASPKASSVASAAGSSSTGTTVTETAFAVGTACSTEGMWNCIGGSSFQQCASGMWSAVESMAAGTTCKAGQATTMNVVASSKFKRGFQSHLRRHLQKHT